MLGIEKQFSQFAKYCGFKTPAEWGYSPMQETMEQLAKDTNGAKPLAELLQYRFCDDASGVVFSEDSIGCWFEIDPIVGSNDSIEKNLTLFFTDELPEGGYMQFLILASHDVSAILDRWERERKHGGEELAKLTAYRRNFIEQLATDFVGSAEDGRLPRNYRTFITYSSLGTGNKEVEELIKFSRKLKNKLKTENLNPRKCISSDLISIVRDLLQMSFEQRSKPKYSILNNLSDQVVEPFVANSVEIDQIKHHETGLVSKIFAPRELPESFCLAEMINLLGDERRSIAGRFVISYTIANNLGASGRSSINSAGSKSIHAASKSYAKDDLVAQEEARQWVEVKALAKRGESFLQESMLVMLTAPQKDIEIAEEALKSLYNTHDWKLEVCKRIQRVASLALLPMMQCPYWKSLKFLRLTRYALSGEVVAKLPIQGEWKGVPTSGALLIGRRGQLFNFSPYYRIGGGGNYNICMMAPSGSGKSFFLQELAQSMLAKDTAMFVLDIGASYKNICNLLGGELVQFNHNCDISLNPFATLSSSGAKYAKALELLRSKKDIASIAEITGLGVEKIQALEFGLTNSSEQAKESDGIEILEIPAISRDGQNQEIRSGKVHFVTKDSIIYAKSMLAAMCGVVGEARSEALIERSIFRGISIYGDGLDITRLAEVLEDLKDQKGNIIGRASEMADSLYPYCKDGIHGRFFASGAEASFKKMLTVFELEELQNDRPLLGVVLQIILMQITMQFLCGDRSRRFMLVVDEAWMILDYAASFLERFARTVRKYGGSLVVCTQDLTSFENKCGTRHAQAAILECSTWKLILQQNADGLKAFSASENYSKYLPLIESLRKCSANKFSELLIHTDGATVVGRFACESYSTALFSTESEDFNFLMQKEKEGLTKDQAIMELSKKYGVLPDLDKTMSLSNKK